MPRTRKELESALAVTRSQLLELEAITDPSDEDISLQDSLLESFDEDTKELEPIVARMAKLDAVRYAAKEPRNTEQPPSEPKRTPDLWVRGSDDPFEDMPAILGGKKLVVRSELRGRAMDVIERSNKRENLGHDHAENATQLVQRDESMNAGIAKHILQTGSDEYLETFQNYLRDPDYYGAEAKRALTLAGASVMLPFVLDPTIVLTNAASANPYRRIANVRQTTSNTFNGVTSAGVTAAWLGEATAAADATPSVGAVAITPLKAAAWVFGSFEALADSDFGAQLPGLLQDARDRLEEAAFATGTGTLQPKGITVAATTTVATVTTGAFVIADVYALQAAVPPRFRNSPNAAWVGNVAQINRIRQFDTAGGSSFWTNLGKDSPEQLLGHPIYESSSMFAALTTTNKILVFGDFSQYWIVDRVGVSMLYEPMITGTGASANLPSGQAGWFMFWRVGADAAVPGAFRTMLT